MQFKIKVLCFVELIVNLFTVACEPGRAHGRVPDPPGGGSGWRGGPGRSGLVAGTWFTLQRADEDQRHQ